MTVDKSSCYLDLRWSILSGSSLQYGKCRLHVPVFLIHPHPFVSHYFQYLLQRLAFAVQKPVSPDLILLPRELNIVVSVNNSKEKLENTVKVNSKQASVIVVLEI